MLGVGIHIVVIFDVVYFLLLYWSMHSHVQRGNEERLNYRSLAVELDDGLLWLWIGNHAMYDKMIK